MIESKQKEQLVNKITKWITSGESKGKIKDLITSNYPDANEAEVTELMEEAMVQLEEISKQDPMDVVSSHLEIYEEIISYFQSIGYVPGINKALRAKEKLLGLLKESQVRVNIDRETTILKTTEYDTSKLNPEEKERLDFLLSKANGEVINY